MMKTAIINTKDWNVPDCMSAARYVEYTKEDFKDFDSISEGPTWPTSPCDVRKLCALMFRCKVEKCNLKKAIVENQEIIMDNISKKKNQEMAEQISDARRNIMKLQLNIGGK